MITLAVVNQKGGSGKTTTAVNLAAALAESGKKVLVLDLDAQCSATKWFGGADAGQGTLELFTSERPLKEFVVNTNVAGVDLVPSSEWYTTIASAMSSEAGSELALKEKFEAMPEEWDYVLVDCPPSLGFITVASLAAVKYILVPVETHHMAVDGLAQLMKTFNVIKRRLNPGLAIYGILPCRVVYRTTSANEVIENLKAAFGDLVFKSTIRENVRLAVAPSHKKPITSFDPSSNGAIDYRATAKEFLTRSEKQGRA